MRLDLDGILEVAAVEKRTGKSKQITIANALQAKTQEEIAAGRARIQELFESRATEIPETLDEFDEADDDALEEVSETRALLPGEPEAEDLVERSRRKPSIFTKKSGPRLNPRMRRRSPTLPARSGSCFSSWRGGRIERRRERDRALSVCQARFRGVGIWSRCGPDLGRLMVLAAEAWRLREAARRAVAAADFELASALAASAQQAQSTQAGEVLRRLSEWLAADPISHRCC